MVQHKIDQEEIRRKKSSLSINVRKIGSIYHQQSKNEEKTYFKTGKTNNGRFRHTRSRIFQLFKRVV